MSSPFATEKIYTAAQRTGVAAIVVSGSLSLLAIAVLLVILLLPSFRWNKYKQTHFMLYFSCLLAADVLQAVGGVMSVHWVRLNEIEVGWYCTAQGMVKQAGGVATAVWSLVIAIHLFNLMFLRYETPRLFSYSVFVVGWCFVLAMTFLGPGAIQDKSHGPFYGISGTWCWITHWYQTEQILLQYMIEAIAVLCSAVLYILTLLRARGNLVRVDGRLRLRFLSKGESWRLNFARDYTDSASLGIVQHMAWYPLAYMVLISPIAILRLSTFFGAEAPFTATVLSGFIFDLVGIVDVLLFFILDRIFSESVGIGGALAKRRQTMDPSVLENGITPFDLNEKGRDADIASINSQTPLR